MCLAPQHARATVPVRPVAARAALVSMSTIPAIRDLWSASRAGKRDRAARSYLEVDALK
jgi:hypothetical protein